MKMLYVVKDSMLSTKIEKSLDVLLRARFYKSTLYIVCQRPLSMTFRTEISFVERINSSPTWYCKKTQAFTALSPRTVDRFLKRFSNPHRSSLFFLGGGGWNWINEMFLSAIFIILCMCVGQDIVSRGFHMHKHCIKI